jgi:hypothetical protein
MAEGGEKKYKINYYEEDGYSSDSEHYIDKENAEIYSNDFDNKKINQSISERKTRKAKQESCNTERSDQCSSSLHLDKIPSLVKNCEPKELADSAEPTDYGVSDVLSKIHDGAALPKTTESFPLHMYEMREPRHDLLAIGFVQNLVETVDTNRNWFVDYKQQLATPDSQDTKFECKEAKQEEIIAPEEEVVQELQIVNVVIAEQIIEVQKWMVAHEVLDALEHAVAHEAVHQYEVPHEALVVQEQVSYEALIIHDHDVSYESLVVPQFVSYESLVVPEFVASREFAVDELAEALQDNDEAPDELRMLQGVMRLRARQQLANNEPTVREDQPIGVIDLASGVWNGADERDTTPDVMLFLGGERWVGEERGMYAMDVDLHPLQ